MEFLFRSLEEEKCNCILKQRKLLLALLIITQRFLCSENKNQECMIRDEKWMERERKQKAPHMVGLGSSSRAPGSSDALSFQWVCYIFQCVLSTPYTPPLRCVSPTFLLDVRAHLSQCRLKMVSIFAASIQLDCRQNSSLWLLRRNLLIKRGKCQKKVLPFLKVCMWFKNNWALIRTYC